MVLSVLEAGRQPIVSVIVPVFNTRAYLDQCLDSLTAQTLQNIEIICVDNDSTDGSYEFLQAIASRRSNVTVIRHAEGRQGAARNAGLDIAKGKYIGFVDSDDFVSLRMFQKMVESAERWKADVVVCNLELYFESDGYRTQMLPGSLLFTDEPFSIQQQPKLFRNLTICNKLFSRDLIQKYRLRFPGEVFHEDQFFVISAFLIAQQITTVPEPLYVYRRQRPGSVNEERGCDTMAVFQVMQLVSSFMESNGVSRDLKALVEETAVLKYLQLYKLTGRRFTREYYVRMRDELRAIVLPTSSNILSTSERREAAVVQKSTYLQYELYLKLRRVYGAVRKQITGNRAAQDSNAPVPTR